MIEEFNKYCKKTDSISQPLGYLTIYNRKSEIEVFGEVYKGFLSLLNQLIYHLDTACSASEEGCPERASRSRTPRDSEHGGRRKDILPSPNQPWALLSSVIDERLVHPKGEEK